MQFESEVPLGVPAVVYEQIDRTNFGQEASEPSSTRTANIRPRGAKPIRNSDADLIVDFRLSRGWQIDAPEVAVSVFRECFEHEAGGYAARNPSL